MGIYRLALAVMVLLSHCGIMLFNFNEGVVAVVQFYLLSGFVMTALVSRYYSSVDRYASFLIDRAARIAPQFYLYLVLTTLVTAYSPPVSQKDVIVDLKGIIANALIVPLDFFMYILPNRLYMPQSWSLGLEVLFYLSFPFMLIFKVRPIGVILSIPVFLLAVSGAINTDYFGYRLLPGTLFMFLLGSYVFQYRSKPMPKWLCAAIGASCLLLVMVLSIPTLNRLFSKEVALGLAMGLPMTWFLRHQPSGRLDTLAGNLSYGVFLCHYAVIFFMQRHGVDVARPAWTMAVVLICCSVAYTSYVLVEAPFIRLRRSMRDRRPAALVGA